MADSPHPVGDKGTLLAKFFASASQRLTDLGETLASLEGQENPSSLRKLARDFHTIKGEARLLGVRQVEQLAHAAEDVLFANDPQGSLDSVAHDVLFEAIDAIFVCLQELKDNAQAEVTASEQLLAKLREVAAARKAAVPASGLPSSAGATAAMSRPASTNGPAAAETAITPPAPASAPVPAVAAAGTDAEVAPERAPERARATEAQQFIQVPAALLERIAELTTSVSGGLVRSKDYVRQLSAVAGQLAEAVHPLELDPTLGPALGGVLTQATQRLQELLRGFGEDLFSTGLVYEELSDAVRTSRLRPLSLVFSNYPSFVRQFARERGKKINVEMRGTGVRVEQHVLDEIAEPCLHLLRNAVAHGIESPEERALAGKPPVGSVVISAAQEGDTVRLEFADDGRGMDLERISRRAVAMGLATAEAVHAMSRHELIDLAFLPRLSTADEVSEVAGRGVGLDVVRQALERLNATVHVETQTGLGSRFVLQVPVSMSIVRALLIEASNHVFALPTTAVVEIYWLAVKEIRNEAGHEQTLFRGELLPLIRLREALGLRGIKDIFVNKVPLVVIRSGEKTAGLIIDRCLGEREVVAHTLGAFLGRPKMSSSVTVLEDGSLVLILHPGHLLRATDQKPSRVRVAAPAEKQGAKRRILYAEDSLITREYAASVLRASGFEVVEVADGLEALEALGRERFDCLLTDLQMPRMDGFKLTAAVRRDAQFGNLPIIVLTTVEAPETKRMALHAGADAYIVKSQFGVDVLMSTIQQVLG